MTKPQACCRTALAGILKYMYAGMDRHVGLCTGEGQDTDVLVGW